MSGRTFESVAHWLDHYNLRGVDSMAYLNRTLCDVLEEMRATYKTRNFASLLGLVEEAQSMGNSMESKLETIGDIKRWMKQRKELSREITGLKDEVDDLEDKIADLKILHKKAGGES